MSGPIDGYDSPAATPWALFCCSDAIRGNILVKPSYRQLSPALNSTFGERFRVALFAIQS